jgi:hypothetical protein
MKASDAAMPTLADLRALPPFDFQAVPLPEHDVGLTLLLRDVLPAVGARGEIWCARDYTGEAIVSVGTGAARWHYGLSRDLDLLLRDIGLNRWGSTTTAWVQGICQAWIRNWHDSEEPHAR